MAQIHGSVFIVIGAGVGMISLLVGYENLILFFWAGIAMIVFGAVKLSLRKKAAIGFSGEHPDSSPEAIRQGASTQGQQQSYQQSQQAPQQQYPPCPYCGRPTHPNFVFCPFCGSRIR